MRTRSRSWKKSALCQLEWRPSRWQCAAHALMVLLMPVAMLATGLPAHLRWPCALLASALAAGQGWRYARQPGLRLVIPSGEDPVTVDGEAVDDLSLHDRGPLLQLSWRRGRRREHRLFWPDTLPAPARRELRLAVRSRYISRSRPAVAP